MDAGHRENGLRVLGLGLVWGSEPPNFDLPSMKGFGCRASGLEFQDLGSTVWSFFFVPVNLLTNTL